MRRIRPPTSGNSLFSTFRAAHPNWGALLEGILSLNVPYWAEASAAYLQG